MINIASAVKTARNVVTANSPALLVGTAIAGVISTGVLAARGGYKARGIVDEAEQERGPLSVQEKAQLTWLCYAIPALTGASTIASTVGVHTIHTKRHAALAGLYAVTTSRLDNYTEEAEKLLGAKKIQELNDAVAQKDMDVTGEDGSSEVIITGSGEELFHDKWSGRYFLSSVPTIEHAVNTVNRKLIEDGDASLNDFYDQVNLSNIPMGDDFGWSGDTIEARFGAVNTPDGRSAVSVWFQSAPKINLGRL